MKLMKYNIGGWDRDARDYIWELVDFVVQNNQGYVVAIPHCNSDWTPIKYKDTYYHGFNPKVYKTFLMEHLEIILEDEIPKAYKRNIKLENLGI